MNLNHPQAQVGHQVARWLHLYSNSQNQRQDLNNSHYILQISGKKYRLVKEQETRWDTGNTKGKGI